ncbi:HopJ type III effector protein [Pseudozobellia thermophila]|uniref:HopJ type III effector protein n=1 Tax=Pseudozobellia thermophila TaxID=192903 RepID=A0A1M6B2Q5_9FLAO|nr:HopJ type III effector protein [Pseudozobellia thermophila]SHI42960.1 HopJ type III effector protein [Pseudozobellia thermophila]
MELNAFLRRLREAPTSIEFKETLSVIDNNYDFRPTAFTNGKLKNAAGENSGSCQLFAFAKDQGLNKEETLACFGSHYFEDVLKDPHGKGHQNIRNFMASGFEGLSFERPPLTKK